MWKEKFTEYLRYEKNYSSQTEISYLIDLTQFKDFVVEETGSFNPSEIDSDIVRIWMSRLMEQGIKTSSVYRKLSSLKTFFNFLERKDLIGKNPVKLVLRLISSMSLPVFVNNRDMSRILDSSDIYSDVFTGCRIRFLNDLLYVT